MSVEFDKYKVKTDIIGTIIALASLSIKREFVMRQGIAAILPVWVFWYELFIALEPI